MFTLKPKMFTLKRYRAQLRPPSAGFVLPFRFCWSGATPPPSAASSRPCAVSVRNCRAHKLPPSAVSREPTEKIVNTKKGGRFAQNAEFCAIQKYGTKQVRCCAMLRLRATPLKHYRDKITRYILGRTAPSVAFYKFVCYAHKFIKRSKRINDRLCVVNDTKQQNIT